MAPQPGKLLVKRKFSQLFLPPFVNFSVLNFKSGSHEYSNEKLLRAIATPGPRIDGAPRSVAGFVYFWVLSYSEYELKGQSHINRFLRFPELFRFRFVFVRDMLCKNPVTQHVSLQSILLC